MARLPVVAGDNNAWGDVLNDYLQAAHNANGTQKGKSVPVAAIDSAAAAGNQVLTADGAGNAAFGNVTASSIDSGAATSGQAVLANGAGGAAFGSITAGQINSGTAISGDTLTADGSGGSSFTTKTDGIYPGPVKAWYASNGGVVADDYFDTTSPNAGATDNRTALNTAIAIANTVSSARKGCELVLPSGAIKLLWDGASNPAQTAIASGVRIVGQGESTQLNLYATNPATDHTVNWFQSAGTLIAGQNLNVDAAELDTTVTLVAGGVAALGLAAGDWIYLADSVHTIGGEGNILDSHVCQVMALSGDTITLSVPLYRPLITVATVKPTCQKMTPVKDVGFHNLTIDGWNTFSSSPTTRDHLHTAAIYHSSTVGATLDWVKFANVGSTISDSDVAAGASINGQSVSAYLAFICARHQIANITMDNCGSRGQDALQLYRSTGSQLSNIKLWRTAGGFAMGLTQGGGNQVVNLAVDGTGYKTTIGDDAGGHHQGSGRGFKINAHSFGQFSNVSVAYAYDTGVAITINSRRNVYTNLRSICNGWGQAQDGGIWFSDSDNSYNQLHGVVALGALGPPPTTVMDIDQAGATNVGNYIEGTWKHARDLNTANQPFNRWVAV